MLQGLAKEYHWQRQQPLPSLPALSGAEAVTVYYDRPPQQRRVVINDGSDYDTLEFELMEEREAFEIECDSDVEQPERCFCGATEREDC
jgi:hypothetical protein